MNILMGVFSIKSSYLIQLSSQEFPKRHCAFLLSLRYTHTNLSVSFRTLRLTKKRNKIITNYDNNIEDYEICTIM